MDGPDRPRDVCDLGQAVITAGLPPAPSGPIAALDGLALAARQAVPPHDTGGTYENPAGLRGGYL